MAAASCAEPAVTTQSALRIAAPEPAARGEPCADVGASRVCWQGDTARVVPRVVPLGAAPPLGYRCGGTGAARVCEDRGRNASAFSCGAQRCLQARPRMPDDGEWECVELSGVVFCHARGPMAGLAAGPADLGWSCGARRGTGESICVDLDADRPADGRSYRCRYELQHGQAARSCTRSSELQAGSACGPGAACPDMTTCQVGLCLPARPVPACWFDKDCAAAERCALGTCVARGG